MKIAITLIFIAVLAFAACTQVVQPPLPPRGEDKIDPTVLTSDSTQKLQKFNSEAELIAYLKANQGSSNSGSDGLLRASGGIVEEAVMMDSDMAVAVSAPNAAGSSSSKATDFSTTNVQVKGVDEADIVKNDGKYIYTLTQNKLIITDAFPAENMKIVTEETIKGSPVNMFINDDKLLVFVRGNEQTVYFPKYSLVPYPRYIQITNVYIYDISDKDDIEVIAEYKLEGSYSQARMIDEHVYFIVNDNVWWRDDIVAMPRITMNTGMMIQPEIYYFDNPENNYQFTTVASIDLQNLDIEAEVYMLGYSNNIYVSQDNIYVTYQERYNWQVVQEQNRQCFYETAVEVLPNSVQNRVNAASSWEEINSVLMSVYTSLDENDKSNFLEDAREALSNCEAKYARQRQTTIVQKIAIDNGNIEYVATGEVPGTTLNQFSMDEHEGNFRIATTLNVWTRNARIQDNNVYVLDEDMDLIGELEGIAPDERIFSTRFLGNRLYMVTFKQVDPFFVIDLSNPSNPKILGELKIPGFSNYLHPYDENHIIGIGRETEGTSWGGTVISGIKLSLFDVSDVNNPKQVDKYEIGDRYAYSEALNDHKAFLFDKEKNILVIPVSQRSDQIENERGYYNYGSWKGAYVFSLTPEDGFELKGKVTHKALSTEYYWGRGNENVRRSLYMDDVLYTVSGQRIKANDLNDLDSIRTVTFDLDNGYYPKYY